MLTYQEFLNLKKIALKNVISEDTEHFIEKCYRYYSKTYHTPLHTVRETLHEYQVVLVYLEDLYEDSESMETVKEELESLQRQYKPVTSSNLIEPKAELDDDEWIKQQEILLKQQEEKKKKTAQQIIDDTHKKISQLSEKLSK